VNEHVGPSYQHVADDIRARITSGSYRVGEQIPSTPALCDQYGMSATVIRTAVSQLETAGVLIGHPGKGVFVKALPEDAEGERRDVETLGAEVAELRDRVAELVRKIEAHGHSDLQTTLDRLVNNLIELYGKTGHTYPEDRDGARPGGPRRSKAARA
jgi:DNA-binding GntR family transcriptional regulator